MSDENGDGMVSAEEARGLLKHIGAGRLAVEVNTLSSTDLRNIRRTDLDYVIADEVAAPLAPLLAAAPDLARGLIHESERADKAERERDALRRILDLGTEDDPGTDECLAAMREAAPGDMERVKAYAAAWVSMCAELEAERDRLARILACERGDESQAPEGWSCGPSGWCVRGLDGQDVSMIAREETDGPWVWWSHPDGGEEREGSAPSALEAMEAADSARKENPDAT